MKYLTKTIEYGLYLLAFLLPVQTRWIIKAGEINGGYWEYGTYSLYGTDILLILLLSLFVVREIALPNARGESGNKIMIRGLICGLLMILFVSVLFAGDSRLAAYKFGWMILGIGLFWMIKKTGFSMAKFIFSLLAGLAVQAVSAVWQFLNQSSAANKWLGMAARQAFDLGSSVIETVGADGAAERWLRAYGGLDHPNMLGGAMAIGILLLCWNAGIIKKKGARFFIFYFFLIIFSAALFFSFSRAAWIAFALGIIAMLSRAVFKENLIFQKNILQVVLISGAVFFILFLQYRNLAAARIEAGARLEIKSISERQESIKNSLPIIKNNWAVGTGLGNYALELKRLIPDKESFYYQPVHNVFLLALSEIGIFGFIFFMALLFFAFGPSGNSAVLIALAVIMFFDHWLWSLHFGVLFFWIVIGLAAGEENKNCG